VVSCLVSYSLSAYTTCISLHQYFHCVAGRIESDPWFSCTEGEGNINKGPGDDGE